jgi:hypothetical protein
MTKCPTGETQMKNPFSQNNVVDHARDLKESEKKQGIIQGRLTSAKSKAAECQAIVDQLGHDAADDDKLEAALVNKTAADALVAVREQSLADVSEKILDLQDAVAEIADQKTRVATAAAIEQITLDLIEAAKIYDAGAAKLAAASQRAADIVPDAVGLASYAVNTAAEVPAAVSMVAQVLRHRAVQTLNGSAPAALPMPESIAPKSKLIEPPPTTQRLFLTQHVAWYDEQGGRHRAPSMHAAELPLTLIAKARQSGAAHDLNSDVQRKHGGTKTSAPPAWEHCKWLNENPLAKSNVEPILHSLSPQFEPHPKPRQTIHGTMPTQAVQPMTATRSNEG